MDHVRKLKHEKCIKLGKLNDLNKTSKQPLDFTSHTYWTWNIRECFNYNLKVVQCGHSEA